MGIIVEVELEDVAGIESLTGDETIPANSVDKKSIKVSVNQIMDFIKNSPILSFRMKTSGPNQDTVLITLSDDQTFQFTKI